MLTHQQKIKKLEILTNSYNIQSLISRTIEENIKSDSPSYGDNIREVRTSLRNYTQNLYEGIRVSSSLFSDDELANFQTVLTGSTLYGS